MKKSLTILALAALTLSACSDEPPKSIKEIDPSILKVEDLKTGDKQSLRIVWKLADMSASSDMSSAAFGMEKTIRDIVKYFPNPNAEEVRFVLNAGLVDKYGNKSQADVLEIAFPMEEIKKINFSSNSFTSWDLLNLSVEPKQLHPVGRQLLVEYCKEENSIKYAKDFCLRSI